jgi:LysM repeat protein
MTERGLPIVDGAPACPFVAFEDDRDARATSPDHRHRCYAEVRPAPRALAHQEAYCLSSAFPVCPTFQDWARREAARARTPSGTQPVSADEAPQRNPPRDWSAPPPWMTGSAAGAPGSVGAYDDEGEAEAASAPGFLAGRNEPGSGIAGSTADRLAGPDTMGSAGPGAAALGAAAAAGSGAADRVSGSVGSGAAGSGWGPAASSPARTAASERPVPQHPEPEDDEADWEDDRDAESPRRGSGGAFGLDRRPRVGATRRPPPHGDTGPSWERPRRYEAYPSLRTRIGLAGLPSMPRVGVMAAALALAAIAVFFLPQLLGVGSPPDDSGVQPSGSASASGRPSVQASPTPVPQPTPQIYIVKEGDLFGRIAQNFGLTIEQLQAANPQIEDIDRINIGDQIIIPPSVPDEIPGSGDPSVAPSA